MPSPIVDPIEHKRRMDTWWYIAEELWGNPKHNLTYDEIIKIVDDFFAPTITVEELQERYARGERDFIDISLPHKVDLSGINLAGANLTGAKFNYSNFTGANLKGANLSYAWLNGVNFTGANLEGANISWATAGSAIFRNANLLNAIGQFSRDRNCIYENTVMQSGHLRKGPCIPFG
ncbi:hypothetical protein C7H19_12405 [Aphanothece hegewaldii CCALA 016]|uniref:Pentapeptide repeat-containing protein n=1 Tax=Aphanothece hegewaldii CCALA 016 TaxID=2107694 RepID=A0A2T1LX68_9CHRO|nr:pentapeptide repeat-containing protein [Aphanothece hegewaldii]PSF36765.1 hypothetical protein C7H19_12405 [Aphanothece hegewaldii CCALA 016]